MSGTIIRAIPKQTFDFSNLAAGATAEYLMVKSLDVTQWTTVWLWLRVHSNGIVPDAASLSVIVHPTAPSVESPAVDFVDTSSTVVAFNKASGAPRLFGIDISSLSNGFVRISVKGAQDASSPGVISADISVDIVAKARG